MFKRHTFAPRLALLVLIVGLLLPFNLAFADAGGSQKPTAQPGPHVVSRQDVAKPSTPASQPAVHPGPVAPPVGPKTAQPAPNGKPSHTSGVTPAFSVSLVSSNYAPQVNQNFTLTATSDTDVGPTAYWIEIYYTNNNIQEVRCSSGTTCSVSLYGPSAAVNANYVFQARIAYSDGSGVQAYSNSVTVHIYPTFTVSLSSSNYNPQVNQTYTLTAYSNQDVQPTPYYIEIYYGSTLEARCGGGTSCSVSLYNPSGGSYTFVAEIASYDGSLVEAYSSNVTVTSPSPFSVSLSSSNYNPHVNQTFTLTATSGTDVQPTPYYIEIYKGSTQKVRCGSGTTCSISLVGHYSGVNQTFQARIASSDGSNVQVYSNAVTVHIRP